MRLTLYDQARTNQLWRLTRDIDRLMNSAAGDALPDAKRLNQLARRKSRLEGRITVIWMRSVMEHDFRAPEARCFNE